MKAVVFLATEQVKAEQDCCRKRFCGSVDDDMAMVASAEQDPFL
jgi:hypothetical protein